MTTNEAFSNDLNYPNANLTQGTKALFKRTALHQNTSSQETKGPTATTFSSVINKHSDGEIFINSPYQIYESSKTSEKPKESIEHNNVLVEYGLVPSTMEISPTIQPSLAKVSLNLKESVY